MIVLGILMIPISANSSSASSCNGFFGKLKQMFTSETKFKSSYIFSSDELTEVNEFLVTPIKLNIEGSNEKLRKFQNISLKRYGNNLNPSAVHAFSTLDEFTMLDGEFYAKVKISTEASKLRLEVWDVGINAVGGWGNTSKGLDVNFAKFFATATRGLELRVLKNPQITKLEIAPSKVVNRKLKSMLENLGFEKLPDQIPDWEPIKGYREVMGTPSEFRMEMKVIR